MIGMTSYPPRCKTVMEEATHKRDAQVLAGLGYKQELHRAFTPLEVFGIAFSIIGLVPSIACVLSQDLVT